MRKMRLTYSEGGAQDDHDERTVLLSGVSRVSGSCCAHLLNGNVTV